MNKKQTLNGKKIIALLRELDKRINAPCRIIICGGAAAIVAYGLKRLTGDIDTFEPVPKSPDFYKQIKKIEEAHGLDPGWFNESAKGFSDCLSPGYKKRLIPINRGFKNLEVYAIAQADFITMKACAWREADKDDISSMAVTKQDMAIIDENISSMHKIRPDLADKAVRVLSELGLKKAEMPQAAAIATLAELIQFFRERTGKDAPLEEIKGWRDEIRAGAAPSSLAKAICRSCRKNYKSTAGIGRHVP